MSYNFFLFSTQILHKNLVKNVCFCQQNWVTKTFLRSNLFTYVYSTPYDIYKSPFKSCILYCKCCFSYSQKMLSVTDKDRVSYGQLNFFLNTLYQNNSKQSVTVQHLWTLSSGIGSIHQFIKYCYKTSFAAISFPTSNFLPW